MRMKSRTSLPRRVEISEIWSAMNELIVVKTA